jgi:hypothetical protein
LGCLQKGTIEIIPSVGPDHTYAPAAFRLLGYKSRLEIIISYRNLMGILYPNKLNNEKVKTDLKILLKCPFKGSVFH